MEEVEVQLLLESLAGWTIARGSSGGENFSFSQVACEGKQFVCLTSVH